MKFLHALSKVFLVFISSAAFFLLFGVRVSFFVVSCRVISHDEEEHTFSHLITLIFIFCCFIFSFVISPVKRVKLIRVLRCISAGGVGVGESSSKNVNDYLFDEMRSCLVSALIILNILGLIKVIYRRTVCAVHVVIA